MPTKINDNLFLGPSPDSEEKIQALADTGIVSVLNIQTDVDIIDHGIRLQNLIAEYYRHSIKLIRFPITDFDPEDLAEKLPDCVNVLDNLIKQGPVYLHCSAGINRSPTVAAAWLMKTTGMDAEEAISYIMERYTCAPYNSVLIRYEQEL